MYHHPISVHRHRPVVVAGLIALVAISLSLGAPAGSPAAKNPSLPVGRLTLRTAASLALTGNPSLNAHGHAVRAAEGQRVQVGLVPNPELALEVEDVLGSGEVGGLREAQTTLQLSQLIELGGKRAARAQVADAVTSQRKREAARAQIEVLAAVAERFIHVVGDQQRLMLAGETTRLAEESLDQARRRVEAGRASPIEEKRARILLARARIDQEHTEHELQTSRRQLAALWGDGEAAFATAEGDLFARPDVPPFAELAARIVRSPESIRWQDEQALRDAEVRLADARRRPDLTAGLGVRHYAGPDDVGLVFRLSLPLTFRDQNQGARAEARALRDRVEFDRSAGELRLRTVLFGFAQELLHAETELSAIEGEMLPDAETMLQLAREGVDRAGFSQLELLDAQHTLIQLRRERIAAAEARHSIIVEMEKLLGESLSPGSVQSASSRNP